MRRDHARPVRRRRLFRVRLTAAATLVAVVIAVAGGLVRIPVPSTPAVVPAPGDAAAAALPSSTAIGTRTGTQPGSQEQTAPSPDQAAGTTASGISPVRRFGEAVPALPTALTGYRWPLPHGRVTLPFGPSPWGSRLVEGKEFHDGVDIATFCGDRVGAAHDGVVIAAGRRYDQFMGWVGDLSPYMRRLDEKSLWSTLPIVVVIDDGDGYRSLYAHFSRVVVHRGQQVKAGQLIGYEGQTGRASGCHVHLGLFAPQETATFGIVKEVVDRMKVPALEVARIDPLLVLPARAGPTKAVDPGAGGHELPPTTDGTLPGEGKTGWE